jgi:hypothetical protein
VRAPESSHETSRAKRRRREGHASREDGLDGDCAPRGSAGAQIETAGRSGNFSSACTHATIEKHVASQTEANRLLSLHDAGRKLV